jgi:Tol biopolymer transport system component
VDGTNRTRVTNALAGDPYEDKPWFANPAWSPVSNKIAFTWCCGWVETHVLPLSDLSNKQYLGPRSRVSPQSTSTYRPNWSPDGSHITY